jgi:hypothetical protein
MLLLSSSCGNISIPLVCGVALTICMFRLTTDVADSSCCMFRLTADSSILMFPCTHVACMRCIYTIMWHSKAQMSSIGQIVIWPTHHTCLTHYWNQTAKHNPQPSHTHENLAAKDGSYFTGLRLHCQLPIPMLHCISYNLATVAHRYVAVADVEINSEHWVRSCCICCTSWFAHCSTLLLSV